MLAVPVQAVVVREVNKEGKVVDPDAMAGGAEREGNTVAQMAREKGEEKDGVFVVEGEKAALQAGQDRHHGRDRHRDHRGHRRGQEIVTGSYKTLRNLKDDARIKVEPKGKKS